MIDAQLAGFLQQGLGLHVGTCDAALRPSGGRAVTLAVDADGRHLTVYVPDVAMQRLRADLERTGQIAISVGRPEDERACQVKGMVVAMAPAVEADRPLIDAQLAHYVHQLALIGIPPQLATGWASWPATAVRVKVSAVFEQSPKPGTGHAIA